MGEKPELDVVVLIPTINNITDLKRCFPALKKQTYSDFRVVVVDGQSTDGTRELVEEFTCTDRNRSAFL